MTLFEFEGDRDRRACAHCGLTGMRTELNPNNNGLLVCCPHCESKRPWGSLLYLKQNEGKRRARPPLPDGATLDSVWVQFGNRCVMCGAPKQFLFALGIGRQVHHVWPSAQEGHKGPVVPICTHCHTVANDRQRMYWFIQRVALKAQASDVNASADRDEADFPDSGPETTERVEDSRQFPLIDRRQKIAR